MAKIKIALDRKPRKARIVSRYKFEEFAKKSAPKPEPPKVIKPEEIEEFIEETLEGIEEEESIEQIIEDKTEKFVDEFSITNIGEPVELDVSKAPKETLPLETAKEQIQQAYDTGFEDGKKLAEGSFRSELEVREKWIRRIDTIVDELEKRFFEELNSIKNLVPELAIEIADIILKKEASENSRLVVEQAKAALELLDGDSVFKISVNPGDLKILEDAKSELLSKEPGAKKAEIIADPSVDKGSCVLETSAGTVDARFKTRLAKLKKKIEEELIDAS